MLVCFAIVLLLALLAAVVEHLAPAAPQGDLAPRLLPVVDVAVGADAMQPDVTQTNCKGAGGHPGSRRLTLNFGKIYHKVDKPMPMTRIRSSFYSEDAI